MNIIVSACLLGKNCKYNGGNNLNQKVVDFVKNHNVIEVCPEVAGGLSIPRTPCEICNGVVVDKNGVSRDKEYRDGAKICLQQAISRNAEMAILKSRSPSCGFGKIYNGQFNKTLVDGNGIFAQLVSENKIRIITEEEL